MIRVLLLLITIIYADDDLEVKALYFKADEKTGIIELNDNVEIKRGSDELYASRVVININQNRMPIKYSAFGGVDFVVVTKDGRHLRGRADEVYYDAIIGEYRLVGNSRVIEDDSINSVTGEEIIINNEVGYLNITGTQQKPAKLIFKLEEDKKVDK